MGLIETIGVAVFGRRVVPPVPEGYEAKIAADEPDENHGPVEGDEASGLSYFLKYSGGSISERRVTIKRLQVEGGEVKAILGHCHERQAIRLFRTDRIEHAVDMATGEVLSSPSLCAALMNRGIPVAEQRLAAMIRILVFMAKCDGSAVDSEWEAIDLSMSRLCRCLMDDDRQVEELLQDARRLAPDGQDFMRALRGLTKTRLPARMHEELRRAIGAVIDADGRLHAEEVRWAVEASDLIDRMPTSD